VTHNGWTNRSTWLAHLWPTGETQELTEQAMSVAKDASIDQRERIDRLTWMLRTKTRDIGDGIEFPQVNWPEVVEALAVD
jgi:hypothetical protein